MSAEYIIYRIENLADSRILLSQSRKSIILENAQGSCARYGVLVIDYFFNILLEEFPHKIKEVRIIVEDYNSYITAKTLKYKNITYNKQYISYEGM